MLMIGEYGTAQVVVHAHPPPSPPPAKCVCNILLNMST